jgi:hypothetical protein
MQGWRESDLEMGVRDLGKKKKNLTVRVGSSYSWEIYWVVRYGG